MVPHFSEFQLENALRRLSFVELNRLVTDEAKRKFLADFIRTHLPEGLGAVPEFGSSSLPGSANDRKQCNVDLSVLVGEIDKIRITQLDIRADLESLRGLVRDRLLPSVERNIMASQSAPRLVAPTAGSEDLRQFDSRIVSGAESGDVHRATSLKMESASEEVVGFESGSCRGGLRELSSAERRLCEDDSFASAIAKRRANWVSVLESRVADLDGFAVDALCVLYGLDIASLTGRCDEGGILAPPGIGEGLYKNFSIAAFGVVKDGAQRSEWNVLLGGTQELALAGFGAPWMPLSGRVEQSVMIPPCSYFGEARSGLARFGGFGGCAQKHLASWLTLLSEFLLSTELTQEEIERFLGSRDDYIRASGIVFEGGQAAEKGFLVDAAKRLDAFVFHMIASRTTSSELVKGGRAAVDGVLALLQDELGITSTTPVPGEVFTDTMVRGGAVKIIGQPDVSKGVGRTVTEVFGLALSSSEGTVYSTASVVVAAT